MPFRDDTYAKYEAVVREMIRHEDSTVNHRITWMATLNGLLFAALGFAWDKADARPLIYVIAGMGLLVTYVSFTAVNWATKANADLRRWWSEHRPPDYSGPGVTGREPPKSLGRFGQNFAAHDWLPFVIMAGWIAILLVRTLHK